MLSTLCMHACIEPSRSCTVILVFTRDKHAGCSPLPLSVIRYGYCVFDLCYPEAEGRSEGSQLKGQGGTGGLGGVWSA
jgi:hypothetical protein